MRNKRVLIAWILVIAWMSIIFYMSNQPGDISSSQSGFVLKILTSIGIDLNSTFGEYASLIIRKSAHFLEYFILCMLNINLLKYYFPKNKARVLALVVTFLYASSDEIHQYFIPGREMAFRDVMIDTLGGVTANIVEYVYSKINKKYIR